MTTPIPVALIIWAVSFASGQTGYVPPRGILPAVDYKPAIYADRQRIAGQTHADGHLIMPDDWQDMPGPVLRMTLAHEATHWLQFRAGKFTLPRCVLEQEADRVGSAAYVQATGTLPGYSISAIIQSDCGTVLGQHPFTTAIAQTEKP